MSTQTLQTLYPEDVQNYQSSHRERTYTLVDVRQPQEYTQEHIPGALNIPLPQLEERLSELDPSRELIFYCRSGRRSKAAASMALEDMTPSPPAVYNMLGGISAWSGQTLPDYPRVEAFDQNSSLEELLHQAIDLEKGAYLFYEQVNRMWPEADLSAVRDMERAHARAVYHLLQRRQDMDQTFDQLFAQLPGLTLEGGRSLQDMLDALQAYDQGGCLALAEIALDIESSAYDLYRHLADTASDAQQEKDLLLLAEQEKGHMHIVIKKLPECLSREQESGIGNWPEE